MANDREKRLDSAISELLEDSDLSEVTEATQPPPIPGQGRKAPPPPAVPGRSFEAPDTVPSMPAAMPPPAAPPATPRPPAPASTRSSAPPAASARLFGPPAASSRSSAPPAAPSRSSAPPAAPSRSSAPPAAPSRSSAPPAAPSRSSAPPAAPARIPAPARTPSPTPAPASARAPAPTPAPARTLAPAALGAGHRFFEDASALIELCETELTRKPSPQRAARLLCDIAQTYEDALSDLTLAAKYYERAVALAPDSLPCIRGARRVYLTTGDYEKALPLFDAEARLSPEPKSKALLHYERALLLEAFLDRMDDAHEAYSIARALDPSNLSILKAIERLALKKGEWSELLRTYERAANAVAGEPRLRAALLMKRARLAEDRFGDVAAAVELGEAAYNLDPQVLGALDMLERLYHKRRDWALLISVLERKAAQTRDPRIRAIALHQIGRLHAEMLGNRAEALEALGRAARATENRDRFILDDLAHQCEMTQEWDLLLQALEARLAMTSSSAERVELLHKMGQIAELKLDHNPRATSYYSAALQIDPTHEPTLQALGALYARHGDFRALVDMYLAEAKATTSEKRRAGAHTRIADVFEVRLQQPADAVEHHARALSLDPDALASFQALTRLLAEMGKYRELVDVYEEALDRARDPVRKLAFLFKIGGLWEDTLDDPLQAAYAYRRVLEIEPQHRGAIHALQRATERGGRYDELVEALEREAELVKDTDLIVALVHRAGVVLDDHIGDGKRAQERFLRVLKLDPSYGPVLASLSRLYSRTGRWQDLLDIYKRELAVTVDARAAAVLLHKMGDLAHSQLGRHQDAIAFYRRAADRDPGFRPAVRALAGILRERGDWSALIEVLDLELRATKNPQNRAHLLCDSGHIYEDRLKEVEKALFCYEQAAAVAPDYWPAQEALTRLRTEQGAWQPLIAELDREQKTTVDGMAAGTALMRQGEIWRDRLSEPGRAVQCFESLLESDPGRLPALLALESLYEQTGAWDALAQVFMAEVREVSDRAARVAALRELARIQDSKGVGTPGDLGATYETILSFAPGDEAALNALQQLARGSSERLAFARVSEQLVTATSDPELKARYLTGLGLWLEQAGDDSAMRAYQTAIDNDTENLAAIRGLMRMATALGDHTAQAQAARREASLVSEPQTRANLLVQSGIIRLEHLDDKEGAIEDLERALELWPEHEHAAKRLRAPLIAAGRTERLVALLSRAAGSAKTPERVADHWLEVASINMEHQGNLGGAFTALNRALRVLPDHLPTLKKLAEAYLADRRWNSAVETYERIIKVAEESASMREAYLALAAIYRDNLDDLDRAQACLTSLLEVDPGHREALAGLADLRLRRGDASAAVEVAQQMVAAASDARTRASALVYLAQIEQNRGESDRAEHSLIEALAIEGPGGPAADMFRQVIKAQGSWVGYATGLTTYIQRTKDRGEDLIQAYLELAQIHGDKMGMPEKAVSNLESGLAATGGAPALAAEMCRYLRLAGRLDEAAAELRRLLAVDPAQAGLWRNLVQTLDAMQRPDEAALAIAPLIVMDTASVDERQAWAQRVRRTAEAAPGSFGVDMLLAIAAEHAFSTPAAVLLSSVADAVTKLYRPELEERGISKRDRVSPRSQHPLRVAADRVAAILGIEYDLYVHPRTEPAASLEMTEPISIVVAEHVSSMPEPQQVFLLASVMIPVAARYFPAEKLSPRELELLLAASTRVAVPAYSAGFDSEDVEAYTQRLKKNIPRKWRRSVETAAADYAASGGLDVAAWQQSLRQTTLRAALLLSDDLVDVIDVLRDSEQIQGQRGLGLVRGSALAADLLRFWASREAADVRRVTGLLPASWPPERGEA